MGTKTNPKLFDCDAMQEDDEPGFKLLGRDAVSPHLVQLWADLRSGNPLGAVQNFAKMLKDPLVIAYTGNPTEYDQIAEAELCADEMRAYRAAKRR